MIASDENMHGKYLIIRYDTQVNSYAVLSKNIDILAIRKD